MGGAFSKVLDTVLTHGSAELDQHDVATLADVSDGTVSKGRKSAEEGLGPLLLPAPVGFAPQMGLVLACSVGSESVRAGIVDANGIVHKPHSASPRRDQLHLSPDELLQRVLVQAVRSLDEAFDDGDLLGPRQTLPLIGAALALPAPVDRDHRLRGSALKHEDWRHAPSGSDAPDADHSLNHDFADLLGPPFDAATSQVMNDCNAAAVAAAFERVREIEPPRTDPDDPRRERTSALLVRVSGGVGLGMIEVAGDGEDIHVSRFLKSRVMVGTNGLAGEIGHLPLSASAVERINNASRDFADLHALDYDRQCSCGKPHHLQALVGWHALCDRLGLSLDPDATLTDTLEPFIHPPDGDENQAAARALEDAGKLIARALTGPVLALDPHSITVIGSLSVPALLAGMKDASGEWTKAFWTGRSVAFAPPRHGSTFMALRGAGLVLLRANRYRKLRAIGTGAWEPDLSYSRKQLNALKRSAGL